MFGSQNTYGGYNNSYGNAPFYPPPTNPDAFWGNKQQNRVNYRNQDAAIANDSLYGYNNNNAYPEPPVDGSLNHIEAGISGLSIDSKHHEDFGSSFAASLGSRNSSSKSWASIASQPAKSQPKSLKSKMSSGLTGSTSKHLPPTVTMDAMSWDSKNGSMNNAASGGKTLPPPAVIASPPSVPPPIVQNSTSPIEDSLPSPPVIQSQQQQQPSPLAQRPLNQMNKEQNSWTSNGNSSSSGSISTSAGSPRPAPLLSGNPSMPKPNHHHNNNHYPHHQYNSSNNRGPLNEINENYNPNKYANQRNNNFYAKQIDNPPYSSRSSAHSSSAKDVPDSPPAGNASDDMNRSDGERLFDENDYNPKEFDLNPRNARFFIIKSYSEDDVHRSIKYSIWCSTEHGNKRLDTAFRQQENKGPIYLFYSVNRSGHFCGVAQMMSPVDYNASSGVWAQDKWKGQFQVKWIYVKDVPNDELRHITLENNENKPVTNSRDTQEVPIEKGKKVLGIIHNFEHRTSIFDDFLHYEKKQEEEQKKPDIPDSPPPVNAYQKVNSYNSGMPPRDYQMPYRGNSNFNKQRSYPEGRGGGAGSGGEFREHRNDFQRNEYRNDHRGPDYRPERNDYRNDRMDRPPGEYGRDNRERNVEQRSDYRDHGREYREYREHREPPQFHRDQYQRDFQPPRDYARERNDYRPPEREFRDRADHRERNDRHQSWRN